MVEVVDGIPIGPDELCGVGPLWERGANGRKEKLLKHCVVHDRKYDAGGGLVEEVKADVPFLAGIWGETIKDPLLIPEVLTYTGFILTLGPLAWWSKELGLR